jgi:hypothetical protein
VGVNSVIQFHT